MRTVIRTRLNTGAWNAAAILLDGFNQDESQPLPSGSYFRPRIEDGEADFVGVGGATVRRRSFHTLVTDFSAPIASGDAAAATEIQKLLDRMDRFEDSGVVFHRPGFVKDLQTEDGEHHVWRVFQPFYYEETR